VHFSGLSRRRMLQATLGATQMALLSGLPIGRARAQNSTGPTKLLSIWLTGGCHFESFFSPFTSAGIARYMPAPSGGNYPHGYTAAQVGRFDRQATDLDNPSTVRAIQGPIFWNWDDPTTTAGEVPGSNGNQTFRPYGYAWADPNHRLYDRTAVLVGADQGTASHASGLVASMSGVAGATFRAPSVQAVVANYMASRFPDRPLPNVYLGGLAPNALGLPALANPVSMANAAAVAPTLSDRFDSAWAGLRARENRPDVAFDGSIAATLPSTATDDYVLRQTRALRGRSTAQTDTLLEQLYDNARQHSRVLQRDILTSMERLTGFERLALLPGYDVDTACLGFADTCGSLQRVADADFALRLLKSDLVTSVTMPCPGLNNDSFDTHFSGGVSYGGNLLRISMEAIGRMLIEMQLTPTTAGRTLLDDTLVYIYSEFGRTFPNTGSDHHPATCAVLVGGGIRGNQMLGGYDETIAGSPLGAPVAIVEEDGERSVRMPKSQDVCATVLSAFGMVPNEDFFLPGGFGVFDGAVNS
jgi:hypothetical protein